jgi:hypothetical protein
MTSRETHRGKAWLCALELVLGLILSAPTEAQTAERIKVRAEADLPHFTYPVRGTAQELLAADTATFSIFARRVRQDLETILRDYDIEDPGVLVQLLSHEVDLQTLFGENAAALNTCERIRLLDARPDFKATGMFNDLSFLRANMETGRTEGEVFQAAYKKHLDVLVRSLPWDVVAARVRRTEAKFERLSADYVRAQVDANLEPYVSEHHALDFALATKLIFWRGTLLTEVPQRQIVLDILSAYIQKHEDASPNNAAAK